MIHSFLQKHKSLFFKAWFPKGLLRNNMTGIDEVILCDNKEKNAGIAIRYGEAF